MGALAQFLNYYLNTWLPVLMEQAGFNTKGSLAFLLVLSGGAILGALAGSRFADQFGPKPVVAVCFLIGAVFIALLTLDLPLAVRLPFVAIVGFGTTGTSILIYGLVANHFPTKMRGAAVAWAAGFGRLGGVSGPLLGGLFLAAGLGVNSVFYVLAGLASRGRRSDVDGPEKLITRSDIHSTPVEPTVPLGGRHVRRFPDYLALAWKCDANDSSHRSSKREMAMYDRILVAIDAAPDSPDDSLERTARFAKMTGGTVHLLHFARGHVVAYDINAGSGLGVLDSEDDAPAGEREVVQARSTNSPRKGICARRTHQRHRTRHPGHHSPARERTTRGHHRPRLPAPPRVHGRRARDSAASRLLGPAGQAPADDMSTVEPLGAAATNPRRIPPRGCAPESSKPIRRVGHCHAPRAPLAGD